VSELLRLVRHQLRIVVDGSPVLVKDPGVIRSVLVTGVSRRAGTLAAAPDGTG
jgi:hypothetical protein